MIAYIRNFTSVEKVPERRLIRQIFCDHVDTVSMGGYACDGNRIPLEEQPSAYTFCKECGKMVSRQPLEDMIEREVSRCTG